MTRLTAVLLLLPLAACGDSNVDFGGSDLGEDRFAIHSRDGSVRLALTGEFVYFALSDSVLAQARAEMEDNAPPDGIGAAISGAVRGSVNRALSFRARYPIAEIRDIRWQDGRMHVELEDGGTGFGDSFKVDDRPVAEAFDEASVRAFATEFRKAKARTRE